MSYSYENTTYPMPYGFGEFKPNKLSEDDVRAIRASNLDDKELAEQYGVSRWTIRNVITRRTFKEVR